MVGMLWARQWGRKHRGAVVDTRGWCVKVGLVVCSCGFWGEAPLYIVHCCGCTFCRGLCGKDIFDSMGSFFLWMGGE